MNVPVNEVRMHNTCVHMYVHAFSIYLLIVHWSMYAGIWSVLNQWSLCILLCVNIMLWTSQLSYFAHNYKF